MTAESHSIVVIPGGPLEVTGVPLHRLVKGDGGWRLVPGPPSADPYRLCRCGSSSTPPFCDREPPFACFDEPPATGIEPKPFRWELPDGSVPGVALKPDGPVRVAGGVPVTRPDGTPADPGVRVSLCRCGGSGAQPLCDGTHKILGFREPGGAGASPAPGNG